MDTKTILVTRTSTVERVETVELNITRQKGDYKTHERIAEELVTAGIRAGQPIDWKMVSEEIKSYPAPDIDAKAPEPIAAPPIPMPEAQANV